MRSWTETDHWLHINTELDIIISYVMWKQTHCQTCRDKLRLDIADKFIKGDLAQLNVLEQVNKQSCLCVQGGGCVVPPQSV